METVGWFDDKHRKGGTLDLQSVVSMLKDMKKGRPSTRTSEIEEDIKACLYELNQRGGYTPSRHVAAYEWINELSQRKDADQRKVKGYIELYEKVLEKQNEHHVFTLVHDSEPHE